MSRIHTVFPVHLIIVTPFQLAVMHGNLEACEYLYGKGADIDTTIYHGESMLQHAARSGCIPLFNFILKHSKNKDVNIPDDDKWTPLHEAASIGNVPMVKHLLDLSNIS